MSLITVCECVTMTITKFDNDKNAALPSCLPDLAPSDFPFKSHLKAFTTRPGERDGKATSPSMSKSLHCHTLAQSISIQNIGFSLQIVFNIKVLCAKS